MLFSHHKDATIEDRYPAIWVILAAVALMGAMPPSLSIGPLWFPGITVAIFLLGTIISHRRHSPHWNTVWGYLLITVVTLFLIGTLILLVMAVVLGDKRVGPRHLLFSGACLWLMNVFVFSLWYWRLDAGGPNQRDRRRVAGEQHSDGCFLFPQMSMSPEEREAHDMADWHPEFVDYLFLAFNTSTALSPTDTAVLGRSAKWIMMLQSGISLLIIAIIASRAVNILNN